MYCGYGGTAFLKSKEDYLIYGHLLSCKLMIFVLFLYVYFN